MSKARLLGMKTGYTPNSRAQIRFKKGKPNNNRCPKCQAKLNKPIIGFGITISCSRCGYVK